MTYKIDRPTWVNEFKAAGKGAVVQTTKEDDAHKHGFQDAQKAGHQTQENVVEKHEVCEVEVQTPAMENNKNRIKTTLHQITQPCSACTTQTYTTTHAHIQKHKLCQYH